MISKSTLLLIIRLVFGAVFVWSGILKLKDPISFADAIRNFEIVQDPVGPALALLIPWVEVIGGLAVMAGILWRGGIGLLLISLLVFSLALGSGWVRGLDIACGCFGGSGAANYPLFIARNLVLLAVGIGILIWERRKISPTQS